MKSLDRFSGHWLTVLTVALILVIFFAGLGSVPWLSLNEARRGVTAREMYEASSWLLPTMNGELYVTKPPFFYWAVLVVSHGLGGVSEWSGRLPSALAALGCCVLVYTQGRRLGGRELGLLAAALLAANAGFNLMARRAEIELLLTFLSFAALVAAWQVIFNQGHRVWGLLSYGLLGCAILTKGPVCLLWVTAPVLLYALLQRDARAKAYLLDGWGWSLMLLVGGSWFWAVSQNLGFATWLGIIHEDIVNKIDGNNPEPWYAYLLFVAGDFLPFWLIACIRPRQLWQALRLDPQQKMLACCALLPLLLFSCFSEKHGKYLLPAYPAAALWLACHWARVQAGAAGKAKALLKWAPPAVLACFAVFYVLVEPRALEHRYDGLAEMREAAAPLAGMPVYTAQDEDMRVVYALGRILQRATPEGIRERVAEPALVYMETPLPDGLAPLEACSLVKSDDWLGKRRTAWLIRLGPQCQPDWPVAPDAALPAPPSLVRSGN